MTAMFRDRGHAGRELAAELKRLDLPDPVVLALPPGGVPVAVEVARALEAPIDLLLVRKVAAPGNPELCVVAIVDGTPPDVVINREIVEAYGLDDEERVGCWSRRSGRNPTRAGPPTPTAAGSCRSGARR